MEETQQRELKSSITKATIPPFLEGSTTPRGLTLKRLHTTPGINPSDGIIFEKRTSKVTNPDGSVVFEAKEVEVPSTWSQLATDIAASKYFRKNGVPQTREETSVQQLVFRIARTIREFGEKNHYFISKESAETFEAELSYLLFQQHMAFNSPVWFNCGLYQHYGISGNSENFYWNQKTKKIEKTKDSYSHPQCSACFIQSVDDSLPSIFDLVKNEARIFKFGSGSGTNFSSIRGATEKLSGGGTSSGLLRFLKVLDSGAAATKSGGTTRRAAKMTCLDVEHPEILDFIRWKSKEEEKVKALVQAGYSADFEGEAYGTVSGQNSNNSVRLSNEFMEAVINNKDWHTRLRTTGEIHQTYKAREIFHEIAKAAWECADPGVQFDTTINDYHTCADTSQINASNPCSEYMFIDDSACNLASINLMKYYDQQTKTFDIKAFEHTVEISIIAQEILVDFASYPTEKIGKNSHDYRPLGLGYANLGTLLMVNGFPYDSQEGRAWCGSITAIMQGKALSTSAKIASIKGPFTKYPGNKHSMMSVMHKQKNATHQIPTSCPDYLRKAAKEKMSEAVYLGEKYGYRNSQVTVLAPTGTIGLLMDCDTTGIEPDFALVKFKKLTGGGYFKIVNQAVPKSLKTLHYSTADIKSIVEYICGTMRFENAPHIDTQTLLKKGISQDDINKVTKALSSSLNLKFAFNRHTIREETFQRLGISREKYTDANFDLLKELGFSKKQIQEAEEVICGRMTIEGCPNLKAEHVAVFDCANPCGEKGKRFLSPISHLKMMAAAQPFLSGAISKTVNMPYETTVKEIEDLYMEAWKLKLKAVAIYRNGSKMSQPLSSSLSEEGEKKPTKDLDFSTLSEEETKEIMKKVLLRAEELKIISPSTKTVQEHSTTSILNRNIKALPSKRKGFTVEAKVGGQKVYCRTGEYNNGTLGEIAIDIHKEGASFRSLLNCFAQSVSMGLQSGIPLEKYVDAFTFVRFEPHGTVDHPNIKSATSVVDFIFRMLGMEYLGRTDFVHIKPTTLPHSREPHLPGMESSAVKENPKEGIRMILGPEASSEKLGTEQLYTRMMGEALPCSQCGHTTIRNGTCYRCLNCGTSMGCS